MYDSMPYTAKHYTNLAFIYQIFIITFYVQAYFQIPGTNQRTKKLNLCTYGTHNLAGETENK